MTQYFPRSGWITTTIPTLFNINDVARFEKKSFLSEGSDLSYLIRVVLRHGDSIDFTYIEEKNRDEDYRVLVKMLKRSKLKVINGKPGPKTDRQS